jgi:hypothetical protein
MLNSIRTALLAIDGDDVVLTDVNGGIRSKMDRIGYPSMPAH